MWKIVTPVRTWHKATKQTAYELAQHLAPLNGQAAIYDRKGKLRARYWWDSGLQYLEY